MGGNKVRFIIKLQRRQKGAQGGAGKKRGTRQRTLSWVGHKKVAAETGHANKLQQTKREKKEGQRKEGR